MTTENEREHKINFFEKQHGVSKKKEEEKVEDGLSSSDRLELEKHRLDKQDENRKRIAGVVLAAIGLLGVSMNIEYSGWLIFFGILML